MMRFQGSIIFSGGKRLLHNGATQCVPSAHASQKAAEAKFQCNMQITLLNMLNNLYKTQPTKWASSLQYKHTQDPFPRKLSCALWFSK